MKIKKNYTTIGYINKVFSCIREGSIVLEQYTIPDFKMTHMFTVIHRAKVYESVQW